LKHTEGPWSWDKLDTENCKYAYLESPVDCILEVTEETYLNNDNLNLIAAAPDLLKELEETVEAIIDFQKECQEAEYTDTSKVHDLLDNIYCDFIKAIRKAKIDATYNKILEKVGKS